MTAKASTSWADETDDFENEQIIETKRNEGKAWSRGNPITGNDSNGRDVEERDRQEGRDNYPRDNYQRDNDYNREDRPRKERKPVPIPDNPPYTAFVGNLAFNIYKDEVEDFFANNGCQVISVKLLINKENNKPKGRGYVEFANQDSLKQALTLNGKILLEREIRIDVAEQKPEENRPKRDFVSRTNSRDRPRNYRDRSPQREREFVREHADSEDSEAKPRPKLNLLPRTSATSSGASNGSVEPPSASDAYQKAKVNPFGAAKPRDENAYLKKGDDKITPSSSSESPSKSESPKSKDGEPKREDRPREDRPRDDRPREDRPKRDFKPREDRPRTDRNDRRDDKGFREGGRPPRNNDRFQRDDKKRDFRKDDRRNDNRNNREDRAPRFPSKKDDKPAETQVQSKNIFSALSQEDNE